MARKRPVFGIEIKYGAVAIYSFHTACRGESFAQKREFRFDSTGGPNLVTPQSTIDTWMDEVRALL